MPLNFSDSAHDHLGKLFNYYAVVVDELAVSNDLINFSLVHPLTHMHHGMLEISHRDFAIMIGIEHLKGVNQILQSLLIFATFTHDFLDVLATKTAALLRVDLFLHLLDLRLGRVDVESANEVAKLRRGNLTALRLVKQVEDLLDLIRLESASLHCN